MSIIIYNTKNNEFYPKILLPAPKCILPFVSNIKTVIKNKFY